MTPMLYHARRSQELQMLHRNFVDDYFGGLQRRATERYRQNVHQQREDARSRQEYRRQMRAWERAYASRIDL